MMLFFTFPVQLCATASLLRGRATRWMDCPMPSSKTLGSRGAIFPSLPANLYKCNDPARDAIDRFDWNAVWRNATILRLPETVLRLTLVATATVSAVLVLSSAVLA